MKNKAYRLTVLLSFCFLQITICQPVFASKVQIRGAVQLVQSEYNQPAGEPKSIDKLLKKGMKLESIGDFQTAMVFFDSALAIARSQKDELVINYVLRKKGVQLMDNNLFDSARIYFNSVENYSKDNNIDSLLADVQLNLGDLARREGESFVCLDYYNSALKIFKNNRDTLGIAGVLNNYSLFYTENGEYDKALENAIGSLNLFSICNNKYLYVGSIINLGNIYEKLGEYDTAFAKYNDAYKLSVGFNFNEFINTTLINMAVIYFRQKRYTEAETEFRKAIEHAEKTNNKKLQSLLYSNLGIIYRNQGNTDLALESYMKGLQIAKEIKDEARMETLYLNLGYLYENTKNFVEAVKYYNEGLALATKRQNKRDLKSINENLANIYNESGDYKKAFNYLTEANMWQDSVLNEEKVRAIEDMKAKYNKERDLAHIKSLQDENRIYELEKKSMRSERNTTLGISAFIIFLLIIILYIFRIYSRKNRVIDAQRIQQLEDEKKLLAAQSVIVGQEFERKRIAQELHDGIGVLLSTASLHFSVVSKSSKDAKTLEMIDKAGELLKEAGGEVRKISQNMMPVVLLKFGLCDALEDMFDKLDEMDELTVTSKISNMQERLTENYEIMLFRVIQEMVNNTLKHANAKNIQFSCSRNNGVISIDYQDDGIGFEIQNLPHNSSLGIYGIQSRVDFLKGKILMESGIGKGTHYHVFVPA